MNLLNSSLKKESQGNKDRISRSSPQGKHQANSLLFHSKFWYQKTIEEYLQYFFLQYFKENNMSKNIISNYLFFTLEVNIKM